MPARLLPFSTADRGTRLLIAGNAPDTLIAGPGDKLIAGTGQDTFVFGPHSGNNTIVGFKPGTDYIEINHQEFADFQAILAAASSPAGTTDTVITHFDPVNQTTDSITLHNVQVSSLHADHFIFV